MSPNGGSPLRRNERGVPVRVVDSVRGRLVVAVVAGARSGRGGPGRGTVRAVTDGLQQQWDTSGVTPVWRTPGEAGVTARVYADIRRPGTTDQGRSCNRRISHSLFVRPVR
jgi:hypothetical protein